MTHRRDCERLTLEKEFLHVSRTLSVIPARTAIKVGWIIKQGRMNSIQNTDVLLRDHSSRLRQTGEEFLSMVGRRVTSPPASPEPCVLSGKAPASCVHSTAFPTPPRQTTHDRFPYHVAF